MKTSAYIWKISLLSVSILIVLSAVAWLLFFNQKKLDCSKVLKKGSKGPEVEKLQEWINFHYVHQGLAGEQIAVDGDFGPQTERALSDFTSDGEVTLMQISALGGISVCA